MPVFSSVAPTRLVGLGLAVSALALSLVACGSDEPDSAGGSTSGGKKIALLLPESKTTRYESLDRPLFTEALKAACADCELIYSNADQDAAKQQTQAEAALTQGANVLVLDPVDGKAAAAVVASAKGQNVPVIAYDRFIEGANYYVSFDNETVGKLQAQTLVDTLKAAGKTTGNLAVINGSPTDPNAADFKKGAHSVLDSSGYKIAAEFDTPDWSPDKAQAWMEGQLSAIKNGLVGVYAANDGTAGGAIAALKGGGVKPLPPVTGQDSELAAIQRIVAGDQAMTIYKAVKPQAEAAAKAAVALSGGGKPETTGDFKGVPSTILDPIAVTKANINDTVVKDGIYKVTDICTASFAAACAAAGLK
ncbi:periplasmic binding protein/LacI transcriptional regulator [Kribbella flavida DSM 17836]|uniref:Periplasmic binding protein/LacI transcriptional regulator n=1 Tax=Kribbella flavida (strain DSM 17836 / JCM 10339 / NBRC 14399) TaxID=479435 RepID=D2PYX5_KRIFD|nr:sugar ABC transporter substrate-binding protein [Kribbella flavida]ADB31769.1 periplasmic binding protein/LacI transcriptional regulator [Kribbella flavida DSM 17836]